MSLLRAGDEAISLVQVTEPFWTTSVYSAITIPHS